MGQKVNPHGLRVGVIKDWDSRWYARNEKVGDLLVEDKKIRDYLKKTLYGAGIPKIEIERDNAKVRIYLHCARPGVVIGKGGEDIKKIEAQLVKMVGKPVDLKIVDKNIIRGFERILWGFFKKMILADWAAVFVDAIFDNPDQYSGLAIFGVLFYTVQLYADFSGGMDVVIGIASMFGIELDENFKRPFFSISITDFWHRWHITLGTWMKDYVFYPVTLSRH